SVCHVASACTAAYTRIRRLHSISNALRSVKLLGPQALIPSSRQVCPERGRRIAKKILSKTRNPKLEIRNRLRSCRRPLDEGISLPYMFELNFLSANCFDSRLRSEMFLK